MHGGAYAQNDPCGATPTLTHAQKGDLLTSTQVVGAMHITE